eukprot:TRINITY_DN67776_c9_g3_i1.p2 TRINITY_DN67776_c9_g3~~TRINITY_DN67776_c9_g3_i1.p2  ORF type:complete len:109 (-),score=3.05 TRINITY_DN67776_c9_g3_i1:102-428(-)
MFLLWEFNQNLQEPNKSFNSFMSFKETFFVLGCIGQISRHSGKTQMHTHAMVRTSCTKTSQQNSTPNSHCTEQSAHKGTNLNHCAFPWPPCHQIVGQGEKLPLTEIVR